MPLAKLMSETFHHTLILTRTTHHPSTNNKTIHSSDKLHLEDLCKAIITTKWEERSFGCIDHISNFELLPSHPLFKITLVCGTQKCRFFLHKNKPGKNLVPTRDK